MKRYKVRVETVKEFDIEIDDSLITEKDLDGFESVLYKLDSQGDDRYKSFAADYCLMRASEGDCFIEGFGYALEKGKKSFGALIGEHECNEGINLLEFDDEGDSDVEIEEIK